jgi:hypothetical protein
MLEPLQPAGNPTDRPATEPSSGRQTVSLTMIVSNEAANLAECLGPLCGVFDEIIIDTGSTDDSKKIGE